MTERSPTAKGEKARRLYEQHLHKKPAAYLATAAALLESLATALQASHGLQLQPLWRIHAAAVG